MQCSSYFISSTVKKTLIASFTDTLLTDNINYAAVSFEFLFHYVFVTCSNGHCNVVEE
jgi:hypothetical protein